MHAWAVVLAAGTGRRFGDRKQFLVAGGARLVDHAVAAATAACEGVVVVLPAGVAWSGPPVAAVAVGGAARADSVAAGLALVPDAAEVVAVADAAHPLASPALYAAVLGAVRAGADAAAPALPLVETLKRVRGAEVVATVPKDDLVAVQTPMAFRADLLRRAHAGRGGAEASDDSVLVERLGATVVTVPGDAANVHVTTPADLELVDVLVRGRGAGPGAQARA
jgi:2-C-methyl-D-erythritol 4-phosphate cytidylyltransferase